MLLFLMPNSLLVSFLPMSVAHSPSPCHPSAYTEATMLFSRQSTLDDLDGPSESIPKTSERARPKLRKMYCLDISNSSADSGSSMLSRYM